MFIKKPTTVTVIRSSYLVCTLFQEASTVHQNTQHEFSLSRVVSMLFHHRAVHVYGNMQNVVGPTLVAMATKFGLFFDKLAHESYCMHRLGMFGPTRGDDLWCHGNDICPPPPNFWTAITKYGQIPTMWQSFTVIDRGSSENAWQKKDTSRVKHKPVRNGYSGRPNNNSTLHSVFDNTTWSLNYLYYSTDSVVPMPSVCWKSCAETCACACRYTCSVFQQ